MSIRIGGIDPVKSINAILLVLQRNGTISRADAQEIIDAAQS